MCDGLHPLFVGIGRAVAAGALATVVLVATRQRLPRRELRTRLVIVAAGVVVGFPLLTSYALVTAPAGHSSVVIGILPAATAAVTVLRTGERPGRRFWLAATLGAAAAAASGVVQSGGVTAPRFADLLLVGAVLAGAVGYTEGGLLARELGGWQVISWALVFALPITVPITIATVAAHPPTAGPSGWAAMAYVSAISMFLGFFAWYAGLAAGPMVQVSQIQLTQPVMSLVWAALLLGEQVTAATAACAALVIACAALAVRSRGRTTPRRDRARPDADTPSRNARRSGPTPLTPGPEPVRRRLSPRAGTRR